MVTYETHVYIMAEYDMAFVSLYYTELLTVSLGSYFSIFTRPVLRVYYSSLSIQTILHFKLCHAVFNNHATTSPLVSYLPAIVSYLIELRR